MLYKFATIKAIGIAKLSSIVKSTKSVEIYKINKIKKTLLSVSALFIAKGIVDKGILNHSI